MQDRAGAEDLHEIVLAPGLNSPQTARRFAEERLTAMGCVDEGGLVTVVVSELVTNAVLHARTSSILRIRRSGPARLHVEVADTSPAIPVAESASVDASSGRGLQIVAAAAMEWGVDAGGDGKTVWAEVAVTARAVSSAEPSTQ